MKTPLPTTIAPAKIRLGYFVLLFMILTALLSSCYTPKNITGNFDLNNLKAGIDTFRSNHRIIHNGDVVTLTIQNVNKDLYTVKITPTVVSYNTTMPSALSLSSLVLPGAMGNIPAAGGASHGVHEEPYCYQLINKEKDNIDTAVLQLKAAEDTINQAVSYNNYLLLLQKDCGLTAVQIKSAADSALSRIGQAGSIYELKQIIRQNLSDAHAAFMSIDASLVKIDNYLNCDSCKTSKKAKEEHGFTDDQKARLGELKDNYVKLLGFEQTHQADIIVQNYSAVTNPANYTFSAVDTARYADQLNFNITISPKNWLPCRAVDTSFYIKLKVARFKIDFSTGVFLNWGNSAFTGKNYFIDSTGRIAQIKKSATNYVPSIGALAHFYYRSGETLEPGLVLGASVATNVQYTNFHAGLSCMINTNNEIFNRIAISTGFTWRYVNDLTSGYSVGTPVDKNLTIDQLESGKFVRGGFISLTYNLSKN